MAGSLARHVTCRCWMPIPLLLQGVVVLSKPSVPLSSKTCERHSDHAPECQPQLGGCVTVSGQGSMILSVLPEHIVDDNLADIFSASAHQTPR